MKKTLFILLIIAITACSKWSNDKERFISAHKDILIARVKIQDSVLAKKEIEKIYKKYDYDAESFRNDYFKYAQNPKEFMIMLDSSKQRARREVMLLQKAKYKLRDKE